MRELFMVCTADGNRWVPLVRLDSLEEAIETSCDCILHGDESIVLERREDGYYAHKTDGSAVRISSRSNP